MLVCVLKRLFIRFLYSLFVAMDANFRLKRKNISSDAVDPGLSKGWSYFVPEIEFKQFLKVFDKAIQPVSHGYLSRPLYN